MDECLEIVGNNGKFQKNTMITRIIYDAIAICLLFIVVIIVTLSIFSFMDSSNISPFSLNLNLLSFSINYESIWRFPYYFINAEGAVFFFPFLIF